MEVRKKALGVVGVGILGCSIALRYRTQFPEGEVFGLDSDAEHLAFAHEQGALTAAVDDLTALARKVDTLVLATPIASIVEMLDALVAMHLGNDGPSLIIDVASVKTVIAAAGAAVPRFVATHPMAGSAAHGPGAARADLFISRAWVFVPSDDLTATADARAFIEMMGALPVEIDAQAHDALVARTSHLPQTISTLLALHVLRDPIRGIYGQGLLDMLRLAQSSDAVWSDIYAENSVAVVDEIEAYAAQLQAFADIVKRGDKQALRHLFERANHLSTELQVP